MKLIPVDSLIRNKKLLLIDDSIVRGTQLGETTEFLYQSGAKEVHIRPACPPLMFGCPYLNFSRSTSELDLITRRIIRGAGDIAIAGFLSSFLHEDNAKTALGIAAWAASICIQSYDTISGLCPLNEL